MVDFTCFQTRRKAYGGANGNKLSIIINDELWMLKLPSHAQKHFLFELSAIVFIILLSLLIHYS